MKRIGYYPGSFDPITLGHLSIIKRARQMFDYIEVLVATNSKKSALFTFEERRSMILDSLEELGVSNVGVRELPQKQLLVDYINQRYTAMKADEKKPVIIRGMRAVSDFEYEFQMAQLNRRQGDVDSVFIMADERQLFTSSSVVREVASLQGDVSSFVTQAVETQLRIKYDIR